MNEGENTGMPTAPDFSSPNASPDNVTPIQPATPAEPGQPTAPQQTASVYSAANSLPGEDPSRPKQVISSGPANGAGARPRFGFSRKFKDQSNAQPTRPAFNNAPDYFNQAVGDIVLADENAAVQKKKVKKIALIAAAALIVIGGGLAAFLLLQQANKPNASKVKTAFNRYANYVLYGEEKDSDIGEYSASTRYTITDKYFNIDKNYNEQLKKLFDKFYEEYNTAAEAGVYKKNEIDDYRRIVYGTILSFSIENEITNSVLYSNYANGGLEGARKVIEEKYNELKKDAKESYVYGWRLYEENNLMLIDAYYTLGCYKNAALDKACANNNAKNDDVALLLSTKERLVSEAYSDRNMIREEIISGIWDTKEIVYEK